MLDASLKFMNMNSKVLESCIDLTDRKVASLTENFKQNSKTGFHL